MSDYRLKIWEEPPTPGGSILCHTRIEDKRGNQIIYSGHMYFVCDSQKRIIQWFPWMKRGYYRTFQRRGYIW